MDTDMSALAGDVVRLAIARRTGVVAPLGRRVGGSWLPLEPEWVAAETRRCIRDRLSFAEGRWTPARVDPVEAAKFTTLAHVAFLAVTRSACFRACLCALDGLDLPPFRAGELEATFRLVVRTRSEFEDWVAQARLQEKLRRRDRARQRLEACRARRAAAQRAMILEEEDALLAP